jgi:hypothetical protein
MSHQCTDHAPWLFCVLDVTLSPWESWVPELWQLRWKVHLSSTQNDKKLDIMDIRVMISLSSTG